MSAATVKKMNEKSKASLVPKNRVIVENVNVPGYTTSLDATMYHAMKQALLEILPAKEPGLTQTEMRQAVISHLPIIFFLMAAR